MIEHAAAASAFATVVAVMFAVRILRRVWAVAPMVERAAPRAAAMTAIRATISRALRSRRQAQADAALPAVLETMARALRSGSTFAVALREAAPARPEVLAVEWRRMAAIAVDGGPGEALTRWASQRPSPDVRVAAAALAVAAEVGGPQARAVDTVAVTLRKRLELRAEIRALTSQARASALLIAVAPVAFACVASGLEPGYLPFLVGTPLGVAFLVAGLALDVAGALWMRRLAGSITAEPARALG